MKFINANNLIGFQGEHYSRELLFEIEDSLLDCDIYIEFQKPDGKKFVSDKLTEFSTYLIPLSLLDEVGYLKCQLVAYRGTNYIQKSAISNFYIALSINAVETITEENENIIRELETTKADNLSYDNTTNALQLMANGEKIGDEVIIGGGVSNYDDLENKPMISITNLDKTNLVNLRSLESNLYRLYGYFKPFEDSTKRFTVPAPLFVSLIKDDDITYMQMYFSYGNLIQYYVITDSDYTRTDFKISETITQLADLETRVAALEARVTSLENGGE